MDIDAVEQRAGDFGALALNLQRRAGAFFLWISQEAAHAGIHRGDEHKICRVVDRAHGAGDRDVAVFQRLAHNFEHVAPELRQLVEKEDPVAEKIDRPVLVLKVVLPQ